jgi:hypothetical protein
MNPTRMMRLAIYVVATCYFSFGAAAQNKFALVIGNENYAKELGGALKNPIKDTILVANALGSDGFDVDKQKDLTAELIFKHVGEFGQKINNGGEGSIGFFYYSGHGLGNPEDETNVLIPVDLKSLDSAYDWHRTVPLEKIVGILKSAAPKATLIIVFDACRNQLPTPAKEVIKGFYKINEPPKGTFIVFSTWPRSTASDEGSNGGPYANALAARLVVPGQHHRDLFERVKWDVFEATGTKQVPWHSTNMIEQDIYLAGSALANPLAKKPKLVLPEFNEEDYMGASEDWMFYKSLRDHALRRLHSRKAKEREDAVEALSGYLDINFPMSTSASELLYQFSSRPLGFKIDVTHILASVKSGWDGQLDEIKILQRESEVARDEQLKIGIEKAISNVGGYLYYEVDAVGDVTQKSQVKLLDSAPRSTAPWSIRSGDKLVVISKTVPLLLMADGKSGPITILSEGDCVAAFPHFERPSLDYSSDKALIGRWLRVVKRDCGGQNLTAGNPERQ